MTNKKHECIRYIICEKALRQRNKKKKSKQLKGSQVIIIHISKVATKEITNSGKKIETSKTKTKLRSQGSDI